METGGKRIIQQQCNRQFYDLVNCDSRIFVHQGGTRSGKTYAICQYLIYLITTEKEPLVIDIVRKTLPALKGSVMRDFFSIAESVGIYWEGTHNKSENTFSYNGHVVSFISIDDQQKIRGRKRSIVFCNEANELNKADMDQLLFRTDGNVFPQIIIDFNPSDPVSFLYSDIITRDDCETVITTYRDNKFLSDELIKEIERMRERDPDMWRVYGEGQKAVFSRRQIYNNWNFINYCDFPDVDYVYLGVDFGFSNDPCAIAEVRRVGDKLFIHELCHKTGMTNQDIADFIIRAGHENTLVYYDSAEPKSGEEIRRMGIMAKGATKGAGSLNAGISLMKEFDIYVSNESPNIRREYESYLWEELKDGTIVNKPVDRNNHQMDCIRYVVFSAYSKRNDFFVL